MDYQKGINAFIQVLKDKDQSKLFIATDSEELVEIANNLPTTDEEIWEIISSWLEARTDIKKAFTNNYISGNNLGPGGSGSQKPSAEPTEDPALRDNLKNEIIRHKSINFPSPDPANSSNLSNPHPPA